MTFTRTDVDDFSAVIGEVTRALRTGGRLVYPGLHPAYLGPFIDRNAEASQQGLAFGAGYGDDRLRVDAVEEYDTNLRPWQVGAGDGRIVPWNLAVTAHAVDHKCRMGAPQVTDGRATSDGWARHK